jgi:hypothetical protein
MDVSSTASPLACGLSTSGRWPRRFGGRSGWGFTPVCICTPKCFSTTHRTFHTARFPQHSSQLPPRLRGSAALRLFPPRRGRRCNSIYISCTTRRSSIRLPWLSARGVYKRCTIQIPAPTNACLFFFSTATHVQVTKIHRDFEFYDPRVYAESHSPIMPQKSSQC